MTGDGYEEWTLAQRRGLRIKTVLGQPVFALLGMALFWSSTIPRALLIAWACSFVIPMVTMVRSVQLAASDADRSDMWALAFRLLMAVILGGLAWLDPGLAATSPHGYILGFAVVIPSATETISAAVFSDRRRNYTFVVGLMTVPTIVAYLVNAQWAMAGLLIAWLVMMHSTLVAGSMMRDELHRLREIHRHDALHDSLTGLLNRKGFIERLDAASSMSGGHVIGVVDVDRFKLLNDSMGHRVGDIVLCEIAARLTDALPRNATIGRLGGDEFVALVPVERNTDTTSSSMLAAAEEVSGLYEVDGIDVQVTVSIGVSPLLPGNDPLGDLAEADLSMYRRKRRRAAGVPLQSAGPADLPERPLLEDAVRRVEVERELRDGLNDGRLRFVAQPVVDTADLRPVGVELLARLTHNDGTEIDPEEFIPIAEESGLDVELGRAALAAAARLRKLWDDDPAFDSVSVGINVSAAHLAHGLVTDLRAAFPNGAEGIVLEFVETRLLASDVVVKEGLMRLKAQGAQLYIDDFGIGYSSLSYLISLPIDGVKLDRTFVTGFEHDATRRDIVAAIVSLTRALNVPCVAEGVEHIDALPYLRRAGISRLQGFAIGRAAELDRIADLLGPELSAAGTQSPDDVVSEQAPVDAHVD